MRGPSTLQRYLGNPKATAEIIDAEGWLNTGDVAHRKDGLLYIVDRKKELIKVRGWQVSPAELEGQLTLHPLISEAAVIGIPTEEGDTELPRAYVVKRPDAPLSEAEIMAYMNENLAKYKALAGGIRFVDAIPKNSIGKVVRRVLREIAAAEKVVKQNINVVDTSGRVSVASTHYGVNGSWSGALTDLLASNPPTPMTSFSVSSDSFTDASRAEEKGSDQHDDEGNELAVATARIESALGQHSIGEGAASTLASQQWVELN